jgi:ribosome-associated heat shock protein Hsp15
MAETQRLDKWLWFARVARTRTRAAELVAAGHVRVNARRIDAPAKLVAPGDILTIAIECEVRVLKVLDPGRRRAAYPQARLLFEEISDHPAAPA